MNKKLSKILALAMCSVLTVGILAACGATQADDAVPNNIPITIMANAGGTGISDNANLMRDFLTAAGFDVTLDLQPDFAGWLNAINTRQFDIAMTSWTTIGASPDYAVRPLFHSQGDSNWSHFSSPRADYLIELAASQTPEEAVETYRLLEEYLILENAIIFPFFRSAGNTATNITIIDQDSINWPAPLSPWWNMNDFIDISERDTRPLRRTSRWPHVVLDPISTNDLTSGEINTNIYIQLVSMVEGTTEITPEGSLSWEIFIAEGNRDFYFILRDDVHFARVEDMRAVNTGVRVGACDVVFSMERVRNRYSVPDHRTFALFDHHEDVAIVTDESLLDTVRCSVTGNTMRQVMEARTPAPITRLTDDKTEANNAAGVYQIVRITTTTPFPQMLNYLVHSAGGILSKYQVSNINYWPVEDFDITRHTVYGDQMTFTQGPTYNHHLWASGPYIPVYRTDYNIFFEANPGFMPGDYRAPRIRYQDLRFIIDPDAALLAFRAGDIYILHSVDAVHHSLINADPDLYLHYGLSFFHAYALTNRDPGSPLNCVHLRLAVLNAICQDDILAFYHNVPFRTSSTMSAMVDTGIVLNRDMDAVQYHLRRHWELQDN